MCKLMNCRIGVYLDEDDGRANGHEAIELAENVVLLALIRAVHVHLRNTLDSELGVAKFHLIGIRRIFLGKVHNFVGESRREQKNLSLLRNQTASVSALGSLVKSTKVYADTYLLSRTH